MAFGLNYHLFRFGHEPRIYGLAASGTTMASAAHSFNKYVQRSPADVVGFEHNTRRFNTKQYACKLVVNPT
jgi:hypothetical protein